MEDYMTSPTAGYNNIFIASTQTMVFILHIIQDMGPPVEKIVLVTKLDWGFIFMMEWYYKTCLHTCGIYYYGRLYDMTNSSE